MQIASHEWNQVYNFPCGKQEQCKKLIDTSPECKYTAWHFETNSTYFRANETKSNTGGTMRWTSISSRTEQKYGYSLLLHATETRDKQQLMGHLACMQTFIENKSINKT